MEYNLVEYPAFDSISLEVDDGEKVIGLIRFDNEKIVKTRYTLDHILDSPFAYRSEFSDENSLVSYYFLNTIEGD